MRWLIPFFYTTGLVVVTLYAVGQLHLLLILARTRRARARRPARVLDRASPALPRVTVQLPIYNEPFVAAAAIDALAALDWPHDRLEIHILDDSTDATRAIVRERARHWRAHGIEVRQIRRRGRAGFKAGALADGLRKARGEYIAVFDADFRPEPDFLLRTIARFDDPDVGFVQARWGHANRQASLLTRIEAVLIDVPFLIGQSARAEAGLFLRFNGSAGVWRHACIDSAGGWSADTLAEDLDLCYRAQLAGWQGRYAEDVVAHAELPVRLSDFRRQQVRWVRGTAQVIRKLGRGLVKTPLAAHVRAHAWLDLLTVTAALPVLLTVLLSVPMVWLLYGTRAPAVAALDTSFALLPVVVWFLSVLLVTCRQASSRWQGVVEAVVTFPPMLATVLGLTLPLARATVSGFRRPGGTFVRTPKFGSSARPQAGRPRPARSELLMLVFFSLALLLDVRLGASDFIALHLALVTGMLSVLLPGLAVRPAPASPGPASATTRTAARASASLLAGVVLCVSWAAPAAAQTSLVPAQHPVYDWLHRQRVLGRADGFAWSMLPLSRAEIENHLTEVAARDDLARADRRLVTTYLKEFSVRGLEESATDNLVRGPGSLRERVQRILRSYGEPRVFAAVDDDVAFAFDLMQSVETAVLDEGPEAHVAWLLARGVRAYADFYGHVGLHLEAGNIEARGDREVLSLDPVYGKTFEFIRQEKNNANAIEASVSARYRALRAHLGHGALRVGAGSGESVWLSRSGPVFDWFRVDIDTRHFRYLSLVGAPASDADDGTLLLNGTDTVQTRIAPARWIALHRLEVQLPAGFRVGLSEMIAWSARGLDLAYLNPVVPLFFAELDNHDRDNAVFGFDVTWQPVSGLELHGAVFVDDADDQSDLFIPTSGRNATRAFDAGATGALTGGLDGGVRYVRLEPFAYAHFQALNALQQRGFPLGHPLGPNADAAQFWLRSWLPRRTTLTLAVTRGRKGLNPVDQEGNTIANVGGGFLEDRMQEPFAFLQGADVQEWREVEISAAVEPWRGVRVSLRAGARDVTRGGRMLDRNWAHLGLRVGF